MLKKFFWNLLSSFVGAWIALLGFGVLMFFVIVGLVAYPPEPTPKNLRSTAFLKSALAAPSTSVSRRWI